MKQIMALALVGMLIHPDVGSAPDELNTPKTAKATCDIVYKDGSKAEIPYRNNAHSLPAAKAECERFYCGPQGGDHCDGCRWTDKAPAGDDYKCSGHIECTNGKDKKTFDPVDYPVYNADDEGDAKGICLGEHSNKCPGTPGDWDCESKDLTCKKMVFN